MLQVLYHRYRYNRLEEAQMREFSEALGFQFEAVWAMYMPVEKILSLVGDGPGDVQFGADDQAVISTLSIDLGPSVGVVAQECLCHLLSAGRASRN